MIDEHLTNVHPVQERMTHELHTVPRGVVTAILLTPTMLFAAGLTTQPALLPLASLGVAMAVSLMVLARQKSRARQELRRELWDR